MYELPAEHPLAESRPLRELLGHTPPQVSKNLLIESDHTKPLLVEKKLINRDKLWSVPENIYVLVLSGRCWWNAWNFHSSCWVLSHLSQVA